MSWFKDLTNKAEALLVKLDQDTAQALQNSDGIISGQRPLINQAIASFNGNLSETPITEISIDNKETQPGRNVEPDIRVNQKPLSSKHINNEQITLFNEGTIVHKIDNPEDQFLQIDSTIGKQIDSSEAYHAPDQESESTGQSNKSQYRDSQVGKPSNTFKKFTIQSSKTKSRLFGVDQGFVKKDKLTTLSYGTEDNHKYDESSNSKNLVQDLGADDIRASINRSLQECSDQVFSPTSHVPRSSPAYQETSYHSHFDSHPTVIDGNSSLQTNNINSVRSTSQLHPSPSFSINVPENRLVDDPASNHLTARLLQQSATKKKPTYLQKVIDRLANPDRHSKKYFGDKLKYKLRRAQMRSATYARRLNYYFKTYPMMKYLVLGYLFLMQLLVIYVLFFYQSSSSSIDLSSKVQLQQQELYQ